MGRGGRPIVTAVWEKGSKRRNFYKKTASNKKSRPLTADGFLDDSGKGYLGPLLYSIVMA